MPRDTGLLPSHSQDLLRAARSGRLYKRAAPVEEDEAEPDVTADKAEKKEDESTTKGFQVKVWKQISRNNDDTAVSHLAKRRKGVVTISSKTVTAQPTGATVTRATVRRTDAAGNPYTREITLQDGQAVDGEIISTAVVPVAAVPELVQPTPPRNRRPPPPKKNKKLGGPGRGRKKKMVPTPALVPGQEGAVVGTAAAPTAEGAEGENVSTRSILGTSYQLTPIQGIKREDSNNPDSEMADNDDDEGDDDGDDGEEGEGEEGDDNADDQDQEMTDASPSAAPPSADTTMEIDGAESPLSVKSQPPNPLLAPPLNPSLSISSPKLEGSPLKNVIMPSPTEPLGNPLSPPAPEATTSVPEAEPVEAAISQDPSPVPEADTADPPAETKSPVEENKPVVEAEVSTTETTTVVPPQDQVDNVSPPGPAADVSVEQETKNTLDAVAAPAIEPQVPSPEIATNEDKPSEPTAAEVPSEPKQDSPLQTPAVEETAPAVPEIQAPEPVPEPAESVPAAEEAPAPVPVPAATAPASTEEGPDLLAGLETALDKQSPSDEQHAAAAAEPAPKDPEVKEEPVEGAGEKIDSEPQVEPKEESKNDVVEGSEDPSPKPEETVPAGNDTKAASPPPEPMDTSTT